MPHVGFVGTGRDRGESCQQRRCQVVCVCPEYRGLSNAAIPSRRAHVCMMMDAWCRMHHQARCLAVAACANGVHCRQNCAATTPPPNSPLPRVRMCPCSLRNTSSVAFLMSRALHVTRSVAQKTPRSVADASASASARPSKDACFGRRWRHVGSVRNPNDANVFREATRRALHCRDA